MNLTEYDDNTLIAAYIRNRDVVLKDIQTRAEALIKPVLAEQDMIEEEVARRLLQRKAQNTKTEAGTAFFQQWTSIKTEDKSSWVRWVIGGENWDYADIRPLKSKIEEDNVVPPGLKFESGQAVHFRKV